MLGDPDAAIAEKVMAFVRKEVPWPKWKKFTLETDLRTDLRMIWEDAEERLCSFQPCQAWSCCQHQGLAVFLVSARGGARGLSQPIG
jgi:hypothetical protein